MCPCLSGCLPVRILASLPLCLPCVCQCGCLPVVCCLRTVNLPTWLPVCVSSAYMAACLYGICLHGCLPVWHLPTWLATSLVACLCLSLLLPVWLPPLSTCLFIIMCACLSACLYVICLPVCLCLFPTGHLCICYLYFGLFSPSDRLQISSQSL